MEVSWFWPLCRCVSERTAFRRNILAVRTSVSSSRTTEKNICNNYNAVTLPDFLFSHQEQKRLPVKTLRAAPSRSDERGSVCDGITTRKGKKNSSSVLSWLESEKCFCGKTKTRKEKKCCYCHLDSTFITSQSINRIHHHVMNLINADFTLNLLYTSVLDQWLLMKTAITWLHAVNSNFPISIKVHRHMQLMTQLAHRYASSFIL